MKRRTVAFSKSAANVFFHILTQCNLRCRHCYINPAQHGSRRLSLSHIEKWLALFAHRSPNANLILLGGEPTMHPDLAAIVKTAVRIGYGSVTIDTNGFLFHDILDKVTPEEVDYFSFSLDGATPETNDAIRGKGVFSACTDGIARAKRKGFRTSLIYTVSRMNLEELDKMPALIADLGIDRFFIQVIGLRGQSATCGDETDSDLQVSSEQWLRIVPAVAETVARSGITVTFPKVYLTPDEPFECAGRVADNYFVFPNGRVYRCPLCEDFPLHAFAIKQGRLADMPKVNESDLFALDIPEGCVMNKLVQPRNIDYAPDGHPLHRIACCLLKEEMSP